MNSNGQRNFSYSSYYGQPPQEYLQSTFQQFNQYFNPESERAYEVLRVHYQNELQNDQRFVDSYKTVMCEKWLESGQCGFGKKCRFAHGFDDIRPSRVPPPINSKYKTRPCEKYRRGLCPYGQRCLFIHPERNTNNNSSMTPSSPSVEQQPPQPPIQSLLSWTPSTGDASWNHPPPPPPTPHYYDSPAMATIPTPFKMASSIVPMANSSASFAYSFPMVQPTRIVLASTQNQQQMMAAPNKSRNLFPQILEELQREKENSTTPTKTGQRRKKWSNFDREPAPPTQPTTSQPKKWSDLEPEEIMGNYDHQREMERIVERLVASPMLMPKQRDCNLT